MTEALRLGAGWLAMGLTLVAFWPYGLSIWRGKTRPHFFSWLIWGITTVLAFAAQVAGGGGFGVWPIGLTGLLTLGIAWLAWRYRGDMAVTRADWAYLAAALLALPVWLIARDPLAATIVLTLVDLLGFGPTLRRAWQQPGQERSWFYGQFALRNGLAIIALDQLNWTTVLFPAAVGLACLAVMGVLWWRRRVARGG